MKRRTFVGCAMFFALAASAVSAEPSGWKAGVARVNITPQQAMWMSGYSGRTKPAERKLIDLWAKALAVQDASGHRGVLVSFDLIGIDRTLSLAIRDELKTKYGLDRADVILAFSHTHTGPVVGDNLKGMYPLNEAQQQLVAKYAAELHKKVVAVVGEALGKLEPAQLAWENGVATFAVNRRNNVEANIVKLREAGALKGPVDHELPVLTVRSGTGKLRAVAFGYACHATVLNFNQWSGDYPGFAQLAVEKAHPGATALFWAGCGGDQNPLPRRTVALAEEYGNRLAAGVEAVLAKPMRPIRGRLTTTYQEVELPLSALPSREQIVKNAASSNVYEAARPKILLKQMEKSGVLSAAYPYPVQVWRLGDGPAWVTLGGEVVVDYSLRLKKELGQGKTWVMAYANDVMAYIPSLRVLKEGGYEGGGAMVYYGLPTVWGPRVEEVLVTAVREEMAKAGKKSP